MNVFISSLISGFEDYRAAARRAAEALRFQVLAAEDLPALADTPQRACLELARRADVTLVILGERYGQPQPSGLSATHEEYREARQHGHVIVLVKSDIEPEPQQADLIAEVQEWETGGITATFTDPDDLRDVVTRALHVHLERQQAGPTDAADVRARAAAALPDRDRTGRGPLLHLVVAGGPARTVLEPVALEDETLGSTLQRHLMFDSDGVFDRNAATDVRIAGSVLEIHQDAAKLDLDEDGTVHIATPARQTTQGWNIRDMALIEEDVGERLGALLDAAGFVLDHVDPKRRLSDVIIQAALTGASATGWLTRAQADANPNSVSLGMGHPDVIIVPQAPDLRPRAALTADRDGITRDLLVRLRRNFTT